MFVINGIDVLVIINGIPIFCGKDCVFEEEKEVIEASTVTSLGWKEFRLRKRSWLIEVTGLTKADNTDGQETLFNLLNLDTPQAVSVSFTDPDLNVKTVEGNSYIKTTGITGPANEFAEGTVLFVGDGAYTVT